MRDIIESQGLRVIVDSQNISELRVKYDVGAMSPLISTILIGVTIDLDNDGDIGCYLATISTQKKSDGKYWVAFQYVDIDPRLPISRMNACSILRSGSQIEAWITL